MAEEISRRDRRAVMAAALFPAAVNLLQGPVWAAGRLAWLCPLLAAPAGIFLGRLWRRQRGAFLEGKGSAGRQALRLAYLLWGVVLLWGSGARFAHRLAWSFGEEDPRGAVLAVTLALALYLARRGQVLGRVGRVLLPALAVLTVGVALLALPGLERENWLPAGAGELAGVPAGAAVVLSLAGYPVFGLFLPIEEKEGGASWWGWCCAALTAGLGVLVGAFGPALVLRMDEPFLYLLGEAGLPGAFQRGEALLAAVAGLGDLCLLALVSFGAGRLWRGLFPAAGGAAWLPTAAGLALAWLEPETGTGFLAGVGGVACGMLFGTILPAVVILTEKVQKAEEEPSTFCGPESL